MGTSAMSPQCPSKCYSAWRKGRARDKNGGAVGKQDGECYYQICNLSWTMLKEQIRSLHYFSPIYRHDGIISKKNKSV